MDTQNRKRVIAVLMGGQSSEHEVSLKSGAMVMKALDQEQYDIIPVTILKDGQWVFPEGVAYTPGYAVEELKKRDVEVVMLALHGEFGEDGTIQGFLDVSGIRYTGSGVLGSALAMDKDRASRIVALHGVTIPKSFLITSEVWKKDSDAALQAMPFKSGAYVVKPGRLGSSVGVQIIRAPETLKDAIAKAFWHSSEVLVQECIDGTEVTCGVLDSVDESGPIALPPTEISPKGGTFFDYNAKYTVGASEEITPARLPDEIIKAIQTVALTAHTKLDCYGMSRSDMIVRGTDIFYLETNTIPGMTETSLLPQAAEVAGISFSRLLDRLIQLALKR